MAIIGFAGFALGTLAAYLRASQARRFIAAVFLTVSLLEAGLTVNGVVQWLTGLVPL